jgi:hypothetical protein
MSWLFDRLCLLGAADIVSVMVDVDLDAVRPSRTDDVESLAMAVARAVDVPQLTVDVLPQRDRAGRVEIEPREVDLEPVPPSERPHVIEALLSDVSAGGCALRLRGDVVTLSPMPLASVPAWIAREVDRHGGSCLVAMTRPAADTVPAGLVLHGLGVVVGDEAPEGTFGVLHAPAVVPIVSALVSLRSFAFGSH